MPKKNEKDVTEKQTAIKRNNKGQFQKGNKEGGRVKGTPNKSTAEIREAIQSLNPVEKLREIVSRTEDDSLRAKILLALLKYICPELKQVEIDTAQGGAIEIVVNRKGVEVEN